MPKQIRYDNFVGPQFIFCAMALSGNIALKTSAMLVDELYEKWDITVFNAQRISALCWCFVSVNLLITFPCDVDILPDSCSVTSWSCINDADDSSRFSELTNPDVVLDLASKNSLTEDAFWDWVTAVWCFFPEAWLFDSNFSHIGQWKCFHTHLAICLCNIFHWCQPWFIICLRQPVSVESRKMCHYVLLLLKVHKITAIKESTCTQQYNSSTTRLMKAISDTTTFMSKNS